MSIDEKKKTTGSIKEFHLGRQEGKSSLAMFSALKGISEGKKKIVLFVDNTEMRGIMIGRLFHILKSFNLLKKMRDSTLELVNETRIELRVANSTPDLCGFSADLAIFDILKNKIYEDETYLKIRMLLAYGCDVVLIPNYE